MNPRLNLFYRQLKKGNFKVCRFLLKSLRFIFRWRCPCGEWIGPNWQDYCPTCQVNNLFKGLMEVEDVE